jgi:hypothetical protein
MSVGSSTRGFKTSERSCRFLLQNRLPKRSVAKGARRCVTPSMTTALQFLSSSQLSDNCSLGLIGSPESLIGFCKLGGHSQVGEGIDGIPFWEVFLERLYNAMRVPNAMQEMPNGGKFREPIMVKVNRLYGACLLGTTSFCAATTTFRFISPI